MRAHRWLVLPLVFCGFVLGLAPLQACAVAEEPDNHASGGTGRLPASVFRVSSSPLDALADEQPVAPCVAGDTMSPAEWKKQLIEWRDWLRENDPKPGDEALQAEKEEIRNRIRAIRDPNALEPLKAMLSDERDYLRIFYLEALAGIGGREALRVLARISVTDGNQEIRQAAARWVGELENGKDAVTQYIRYLRAQRYSGAAAEALSTSGLARQVSMVEEPDPALTNALINALVVKGTKLVPVECWRYAYWSTGKRSSSHYREDRVYVRVEFDVLNPKALKTLREYTGENYGYDQKAWKRWYQKRRRMIGNEH